jgi:hypothetical protein
VGFDLAALVAGAQRGIAESDGGATGSTGPAVGDPAPDFELTPLRFYDFRLDEREITRENAWELYEPVRLRDFRGKRPVALIFGSFTSPVRAQLPALEGRHRAYGDRVQFLFVYIREAGAGESAGEEPALDREAPREPETHPARSRIANSFANEVELSIPCVVDGMDDAAMLAYAAHPARLYLVGSDGRIAFAGRPGSLGLDPEGLDAVLSALSGNADAAHQFTRIETPASMSSGVLPSEDKRPSGFRRQAQRHARESQSPWSDA